MEIATLEHLGNLCKTKQFSQALAVACSVAQRGVTIPRETIYSLLQGYGRSKDLTCAKKIHWLMVRNKLDRVPVLADHLIRLFVACGCLEDAQHVFSKVSKPSVYTWNAILTAYSNLGNIEVVLDLFCQMQQSGLKPDRVTILCMLRACGNSGSAENGRLIHEEILRGHLEFDLILGSALVDMYSKCAKLEDAKKIFDDLSHCDAVVWGALIAGYAQHGDGRTALQLFTKMQGEGIISNEIIFSSVLKACSRAEAVVEGRILHSQIAEAGLDGDLVIVSSLIDMYSRTMTIEDAQRLFQNVTSWDSVLWATMVAGYALCGLDQLALDTFKEMLQEGLIASKPMLLCVIKAASNLRVPAECRMLHDLLIRIKIEQDLMLCNALIDTYAKCSTLDEAERVFKCMQIRDIVSWTSLIAGYEEQGDCKTVMKLFLEMQENGITPDRVVLLSTLKACAGLGDIDQGRTIHSQLVGSWGLAFDLFVCNALIDMYSKCGRVGEAHAVFNDLKSPNEFSWGAIISGYVNDGNGQVALELAKRMLETAEELGKVVLLSTMKACTILSALPEGRLLHNQALQSGLAGDLDIGCTALNMYAKCGCLEDATRVFDKLPVRDSVAWTSMILSYAECGGDGTAIGLFMKMQEEGIRFNAPILLCVMEECGGIDGIIQGRLVHHQVLKYGLESNAAVLNLLIGMFAKFQSLQEARRVFDAFKCRDGMTWATIIAAYIHSGENPLPFDLFREFEGVAFGREMLMCILKACSSTCSLEQGRVAHFLIFETGMEADLMIGSTLINMYTKCRSLHDSLAVFNELPAHDLVTYSALITGLVEFHEYFLALELYAKLQHRGLKADKHLQQCMLKVCGILNLIKQGRQIHDEIIKNELDSDAGVRSALVDMYTNCASLAEAHKVFDSFSNPDATLWGTIIAGYTYHGDCKKALQCIEDMEGHRIKPTGRMFSSILAACSHAGALEEGCHCFNYMTEKFHIVPRVEHLNCMIDLFGRAGHLDTAIDLITAMPTFPDVIGRKAFLNGCRIYGQVELGNESFDHTVMLDLDNTPLSIISDDACMEDTERSKAWRSNMDGCTHADSAFLDTCSLSFKKEMPGFNQLHIRVEDSNDDKDAVFWASPEEKGDCDLNLRVQIEVPQTCSL